MSRLLPNPIGDLTEPLGRIEKSVERLGGQLEDIHTLPRIDDHLAGINRGIAAILEVLGEVRGELRTLNEATAANDAPRPAAPR